MQVKDVAKVLEQFAPLQLQESYDNAGLSLGNPDAEVTGILITIDVTEEVLEEAISKKCNLIISHHPLIFESIKSITGKNFTERCITKAILNNVAIYSAHTNLDSVFEGVSHKMCEKLALNNCRVLSPLKGELKKLVTFVPLSHVDKVREAIFNAGAGSIGNYDCCSFNIKGSGTFRGNEESRPFVGEKGKLHFEEEIRIETIFPSHLKTQVIDALLKSHPYEEVAYDIYSLDNIFDKAGLGMIGEMLEEKDEKSFLSLAKSTFDARCIRHTNLSNKKIKKVAVCGGSGSSLLGEAIRQGADVFISGDFKYHQFFQAENKILIIDIGHYESEQFTKEIFYNLLMKNFPNFAVHFSNINTNPINYI
jgi:dinuclear metal center YbgI/SA1388 family protein